MVIIPGAARQVWTTMRAFPSKVKAKEKNLSPASRKLRKNVKTPNIVEHLRELEIVSERYGARAAGRQGYIASSRYVESVLRGAGYDPQRQYFDFTYSELIEERLTVGANDIENVVMTGSPNTPGEGVTADLVEPAVVTGCDAAAWDGVDATGKIALVCRGSCSFAAKSVAAGGAGALGTVIYNSADGDLNGTLGETPEGTTPTTGITQAAGQALAAQVAGGPLKKQTKRLDNKVRFAFWGAEELGLLGSTHYVNEIVENSPGTSTTSRSTSTTT